MFYNIEKSALQIIFPMIEFSHFEAVRVFKLLGNSLLWTFDSELLAGEPLSQMILRSRMSEK